MPDVLIIGDSMRSPELRHEVPLSIGDPFLYAEVAGIRHVAVSVLELSRVEELGGDLEVHTLEEFDYDAIIARGLPSHELWTAIWVSAADKLGIRDAVVPLTFPLGHAEALRTVGIELRVDQPFFDDRRRVKNATELEGIRRASRAVEAGMTRALELLHDAEPSNGALTLGGDPLTCERIRAELEQVFGEHGAVGEEFIVSHGAQTAVGHDPGSGQIAASDVVLFDLYPRDRETGCYTDFTRTVAVGEVSDEIREYHRLAREALDVALAAVRPGVEGEEIHRQVCEFFYANGQKTQLHKEPGEVLRDGYYHGTGHGVGLEVHEQPGIGRTGGTLVAGDVIAIEPGLYRHGFGGVRLEDLVLVTEEGAEVLTSFPYDLEL
ncbi:MAG: Xaa-Pro peptidase family protein [Gaiellaceae bacterium MAG52_C11]|nr:Xaa-Pro peptidase family protein [Candidatus Gaiellasilicea maunaloa]